MLKKEAQNAQVCDRKGLLLASDCLSVVCAGTCLPDANSCSFVVSDSMCVPCAMASSSLGCGIPHASANMHV